MLGLPTIAAVRELDVEPVVVIERTSRLARPAAEVWARVTTPAGINHEVAPWLQMTVPRGWSGSSLADVVAGTRLGRSWILALGLVPVDYDDLHIECIGDGYFREVSTMASAARSAARAVRRAVARGGDRHLHRARPGRVRPPALGHRRARRAAHPPGGDRRPVPPPPPPAGLLERDGLSAPRSDT